MVFVSQVIIIIAFPLWFKWLSRNFLCFHFLFCNGSHCYASTYLFVKRCPLVQIKQKHLSLLCSYKQRQFSYLLMPITKAILEFQLLLLAEVKTNHKITRQTGELFNRTIILFGLFNRIYLFFSRSMNFHNTRCEFGVFFFMFHSAQCLLAWTENNINAHTFVCFILMIFPIQSDQNERERERQACLCVQQRCCLCLRLNVKKSCKPC